MFQSFQPKIIVNTKFLFFTGKGGVGKTSTACATAVALADDGKKVLIVSTDPASNLQDVLEVGLTNTPVAILMCQTFTLVILILKKLQEPIEIELLGLIVGNFLMQ
ncbi:MULTISPECIES: ArsA family ATPase [Bacillaceae]|uniref:ArsA family ATPase n=1 Tax=Bacillaceae TaxID=186817 RepID=UPI002FFE44C9